MAALLKSGESLPAGWGSGERVAEPVAVGVAAPASSAPTQAAAVMHPPVDLGRIKASPLARKVAEQLGVSLTGLTGTGPGGRIVEKDVQAAASGAPPAIPQPAAPILVGTGDRKVSLTRLRAITAQRTLQAKQQAPHYYVTVEADVEKLLGLKEMFEEEESGKVSINDFVVKACALALIDLPEVNATFSGDSVTEFGAVHIGIAAAVDEGLTVPVLRNAGSMTLRQIAEHTRDLVKRARENKLSLDELTGSTFSISNMGMLEVDNFIAIINQPNAAILAVSSVRKKVVPTDEDELEIRRRMNLTCSFDHRVVDGARGAVFLNKVREYLENPTRLLA
ncbi:MAG: 2-oxo acid dehydrogenase subunit E2 [Fimbriimonas ginsengisoli]|nr:2-oxo acid dehydrogenase subunit E2 [Fimbriimonas ginsengisoli]